MATTIPQPAAAPTRWRRVLLLVAALIVLLVTFFVWCPGSALTVIATARLRLSGIESRYVQLGPYRIHCFIGGTG